MKKSKFIALSLASVMAVSTLVGCGSSANDPVVMSIGNYDIKASEYTHTLHKAYMELSSYVSDTSSFSYSESFEDATAYAISLLEEATAMKQLLDDNGIKSTSETEALVESEIATLKDQMGAESFKQVLRNLGITEEYFIQDSITMQLFSDFVLSHYGNADLTDEELYDVYDADYMKAKHILIPIQYTSYDQTEDEVKAIAKAEAEAVLAEINGGLSFDDAIEEYSLDAGQPQNGYAFTDGYMIEEFENAVKSLQVNQMSGLVETDYGYHIVFRLPSSSENFDDNYYVIQEGDANAAVSTVIIELAESYVATFTDEFDKITSENYGDYLIYD